MKKVMNSTNEEYHCAFHSSYKEMNTSILMDKSSIVVAYDCYAVELIVPPVVDQEAMEEDQNHHLKPWEYQVWEVVDVTAALFDYFPAAAVAAAAVDVVVAAAAAAGVVAAVAAVD